MTNSFDVVVIGGGIGGMSIAATLAEDGRVALLEAEDQLAYHTTGRSAAIYIPSYGPPASLHLTRWSGALFENLPAEHFPDPVLTRNRGVICLSRIADDPQIREMMRHSDAMETISVDEACRKVPILRGDGFATATFEAFARDIDIDALHGGFRRQFLARGGTIEADRRVTGLARNGGAWAITAGADNYTAPIVVNAAGAWSDEVAQLAGLAPIGMRPLKRTGIIVPAPEGREIAMWPTVYDHSAPVYFKPDAGRMMLSPADETPSDPHDAYSDDMEVAEAVDRMQQMVDYEITRVEHSWAGLRTFSPDDEPVTGFDPATDGFFWFAGQGGFGIQMSPAYARLGAALLLGKPVPDPLIAGGFDVNDLLVARFRS